MKISNVKQKINLNQSNFENINQYNITRNIDNLFEINYFKKESIKTPNNKKSSLKSKIPLLNYKLYKIHYYTIKINDNLEEKKQNKSYYPFINNKDKILSFNQNLKLKKRNNKSNEIKLKKKNKQQEIFNSKINQICCISDKLTNKFNLLNIKNKNNKLYYPKEIQNKYLNQSNIVLSDLRRNNSFHENQNLFIRNDKLSSPKDYIVKFRKKSISSSNSKENNFIVFNNKKYKFLNS